MTIATNMPFGHTGGGDGGGICDAVVTADAGKIMGSRQATLSFATVEIMLRAAVVRDTGTVMLLAPEVGVALHREVVIAPSFVRAIVDSTSPEDMTNRVTVVITTSRPTLRTRMLI